MKIAQVAPLYESVPPKLYGGTERVVSFLTEELVRQGHEVTLFASGDSITKASLASVVPEALRLRENCEDMMAPHFVQFLELESRATEFDIIHFHTDYLGFPFTAHLGTPYLTTLHGKLNIPELRPLYKKYSDQPVVCISQHQRIPLPEANFIGKVYHGIPEDLFHPVNASREYFAFLGRISPEKRCDRAIEMAIATNTPLKIAAKVDKADKDYFHQVIRPLLNHPLVSFIGEINEHEKQEFLGNAKALLFPIDWPEPFGLVMIEAMACGTPVIAWNQGSVPEIITHGKTGFIVNDMPEAIEAVSKINSINRKTVRRIFEERFTAKRMAQDYLEMYKRLIHYKKYRVMYRNQSSSISPKDTNEAKAVS